MVRLQTLRWVAIDAYTGLSIWCFTRTMENSGLFVDSEGVL